MKRRTKTILATVLGLPVVSVLGGLIATGASMNWGPFSFLHSWEGEVSAIESRYDANERKGEIVFYGASNFRLWKDMGSQLHGLKIQNHAFGGSTDSNLVEYADRLVYPYNPAVLVLQTGSNDYPGLTGNNAEKAAKVIGIKEQLLESFHEKLPETQIVVISGILMPGRSDFTPIVEEVNVALKDIAESSDYISFVDASELTWDGEQYKESMFIADRIHLTDDARKLWCDKYIRPALEEVIQVNHLDKVRAL